MFVVQVVHDPVPVRARRSAPTDPTDRENVSARESDRVRTVANGTTRRRRSETDTDTRRSTSSIERRKRKRAESTTATETRTLTK